MPEPLRIARQGCFFTGGRYAPMAGGGQAMRGQMFVQFQIPAEQRRPEPGGEVGGLAGRGRLVRQRGHVRASGRG